MSVRILDVREITAERPVWSGCPPLTEERRCAVQLRAHGEVYDCTAVLDGATLRIRLDRPARGVARGQAAVLYAGDLVLGSATISATISATSADASADSCADADPAGRALASRTS